ncbi:MAG: iron uptake porin [Elainella sp. Prado103]|jgi:hypothetical protein|nr:iron uptake porin [Elainella sp. Prado103]
MISKPSLSALVIVQALFGVLTLASSAIANPRVETVETVEIGEAAEIDDTTYAPEQSLDTSRKPSMVKSDSISTPSSDLASQLVFEREPGNPNSHVTESGDAPVPLDPAIPSSALDQLTSVTQLSDVQPTDWAYQALQSLVERYGCIVGYPDSTYRGQRALSRFEFAAGMNACLDRVSELLAASTSDLATKEDLATLQRLQEEFAAELAALRGRVDVLDARVTELETNQFSTTTKLTSETIFSLSDIYGGNGVSDANQTIFQSRVRLNFDTSFYGNDQLRARLQYRNTGFFNLGDNEEPLSFTDGDVVPMVAYPSPYVRQSTLYYQFGDDGTDIKLSQLFYRFAVGDGLQVVLGATGTGMSDVVSTVSPIDAGGFGSISLLAYNPIYDAGATGTGLGITYDFTDDIQLGLGYLTGDAGNPLPGRGLFNGGYTAFGQLTFSPGNFTAALSYANAYLNTPVAFQPAAVSNIYALSLNYGITPRINLGGWFAYEDGKLLSRADYQSFGYAGYLAINDLGATNNQLILALGVPPRISDYQIGDERIGEFIDDAALNAEISYRIAVNESIYVTPGLIWTTDPGNDNENADIFLPVIRTTFYF